MLRFLKIALLLCSLPLFALDVPVAQIPDDSYLRFKLKDAWITEVPNRVISRGTIIEQLENGDKVEVRAREGNSEIMVSFSRELMRGQLGTGQFPGWAQGSWMLTRRKDTGEGVQIRIFLRSDQNTFIQLRPFTSEKSQMDMVLYGGYIVRSLPIAVPFERLYTMSVNDIIKLAGDRFPIHYYNPDPSMYRDSRRFVASVREHIKNDNLKFADDGAIDEHGNYVYIATLQPQNPSRAGLNCSGFAKWLIDGCLRPITGKRLSIETLKAPYKEADPLFEIRGSAFTANWEERRDPYFGLDWIRNLAAAANGTLRAASYSSLDEFEVRENKFSYVIINANRTTTTVSYPGFLGEAGYGTEGLYPLLYTLAVDHPFSFYLAAVNNEFGQAITQENPRGGPRLRQYFHIAALVPYFDELGNFRIAVFESAAETSFAGFRGRYPGHYVNLVQVPVPSRFEP